MTTLPRAPATATAAPKGGNPLTKAGFAKPGDALKQASTSSASGRFAK